MYHRPHCPAIRGTEVDFGHYAVDGIGTPGDRDGTNDEAGEYGDESKATVLLFSIVRKCSYILAALNLLQILKLPYPSSSRSPPSGMRLGTGQRGRRCQGQAFQSQTRSTPSPFGAASQLGS
jgi:hypothetical protein